MEALALSIPYMLNKVLKKTEVKDNYLLKSSLVLDLHDHLQNYFYNKWSSIQSYITNSVIDERKNEYKITLLISRRNPDNNQSKFSTKSYLIKF